MMKKNNKEYDLVVIGGGPAVTPVAMEYAMLKSNQKILLIDKKGKLGGECLFDGCIPSKILEISAKNIEDYNKVNELGIFKENIRVDWNIIKKRKKDILKERSDAALKKLLSYKNIEIKKGTASFNSKKTLVFKNDDGVEEEIKFKKVVIGAGSRTFIPPFKGNGLDKIWTNTEFFDKMELPKELTIIGAGPVGIELSQILSNLGVKINLINNFETILPMIDKKYSNIILDSLKKNNNINLILGVNVEEINFENNKFDILYTLKGNKKVLKSEKVLIATGVRPNIEDLNLEKAGINFNKKGIIVDKFLNTSNKNIYAVGDVVLNYPKFAHSASYGAHIVTQNLFFNRNKVYVDFSKNSWVLFSNPNFVFSGITEKEAKEKGFNIIVGEYDYSIDAKAQIENEALGFLKFIVDKKTLRILGIEIINEDANGIAGEAALIVSKKITLLDLIDSIHPHPTLSESFVFLAKSMMAEIMKEKINNPMFKFGFFIKKWFL